VLTGCRSPAPAHARPESVFAYEAVGSRLADATHLVAIDLPGFGRSDRRNTLMSLRAMGDFIVRAADALVHAPTAGGGIGPGPVLDVDR
jgi:pimeloyl-ACP methyl ester carboxylesterase